MLKKTIYMPLWVALVVVLVFFIFGWSARTSWDTHHVKVQAVTVEPGVK